MSNRIEIDSSQPDPLAFSLVQRELEGNVCVLAVEGELDLATAPDLKEMLAAALRAGSRIVVDLGQATFMDSTALNVLLEATHRLGEGARLAIVCTRPSVLRIFEFSGLEGAFAIFDQFDEALTHVRGEQEASCTS
jgi:anti-sigma B factor antagonist